MVAKVYIGGKGGVGGITHTNIEHKLKVEYADNMFKFNGITAFTVITLSWLQIFKLAKQIVFYAKACFTIERKQRGRGKQKFGRNWENGYWINKPNNYSMAGAPVTCFTLIQ